MATSTGEFEDPPEYEALKQFEDELIRSLQSADLLRLAKEAAICGLIDTKVRTNIESMDPSVPHRLICRYLFYSVYTNIEQSKKQSKKPYNYKKWLNLLSHINSVASVLSRIRQPCVEQTSDFTEEHIAMLTEILAGYSSKWKEIAISLGLPSNEVENIVATMHLNSPVVCLNKVLTSWVTLKYPHAEPPSLQSLEKALGSLIVGLGKEASCLRKSIVEKITTTSPHSKKFDLTKLSTEDSLSSNAFEIISQTCGNVYCIEGKCILFEIEVRTPQLGLNYEWHKDEFVSHDSDVINSFRGFLVLIKCLCAQDLTTEGTYECKMNLRSGKCIIVSEPILLTVITPIDTYRKVLTDFYTEQPAVPEDTWPPVIGSTYISLALIKQEGIHAAGKYGRCTIRGDVDDIYKDKESTNYTRAFGNLGSGVRMLVEGRPGSGKTTLVHKVSQDWANDSLKLNRVRVLFLVHLRAFSVIHSIDLSTILSAYYSSSSAVHDIIEYADKHSGLGLCFILDGLDEYLPDSNNDYIFRLIKKQVLPRALVIVASRPAAASRFRSIATIQVEVLGFLKEQISEYIRHYKFSAESKSAELQKYLHQHPNVHHMCYLPIHVAMVCFLFDIEADIPITETEIYREFTRYSILRMLRRFEDDLCISSLEDLPSAHQSMYMKICKLAYEMTLSSKQVMQQAELCFTKHESDLLGLITVDEMARMCGFQRMYTFLHLTFQEFLGAFHISHLPGVQQMELIEKYGEAKQMQQVWKFYCGLTNLELNEVFKALFTKSSHHKSVHIIQCIFESQKPQLCDFVVQNNTLALSDSFLNHGDFTAIAYIISSATKNPVQELSFDGCVFGSEEVTTLVLKAGDSISQIITLSFHERNAAEEQIRAANILAHSLPSLELFNLGNTNIDRDAVFALTEILYHPTLQVLKVGSRGNDLYRSLELPLQLASNFKAKCNSFSNICFSGNKGLCLSASAQWPLPFCFCCNHPRLMMSCQKLCPLEVKALSHDLKAYLYTHLTLINCSIDDQAMTYLADGVNCCNDLEVLELSCNKISDIGAICLANGIRSCPTLHKLDLSFNRIGNEGAIAVANSVSSDVKVYFCHNHITKFNEIFGIGSNTNFNMVDVSDKGLLDSDVSLLTTMLSDDCEELLQLYLQRNCISSSGMTPLSCFLNHCSNLLVLNLSSNNIQGKGALVLASALTHCTRLLKLDVSSNNLGSDGASAIAQVLTCCTKMVELNVSFNNIGHVGIETIARALHHCTVLQELEVSSNNLGAEGALVLADALKHCGSILALHASFNNIGSEGAKILGEGLKHCSRLQVLAVDSNEIGFDGAEAIANALEHCPLIHTLTIGSNHIKLEGIVAIFARLGLCSKLQKLDICYNAVPGGILTLANMFSYNQNLTSLNMNGMNLGSCGVESLARGMSNCLSIRELHLHGNNIGDYGARTMACILEKCENLQVLDVSRNSIGVDGTTALASALRGKEISVLDFSVNYLGHQGALALSEALNPTTIRILNIENCRIGRTGALYLARSLGHYINLQELNISGNSIEDDGAIAIAKCLPCCLKLCRLYINDHCLSGINIGRYGWKALAEALTKCTNLRALDISTTSILRENSLTDFFRNCVHLQELNVSELCTKPVHEQFIRGLKFCVNLEKIDVSSYSLSEEMMAEFCFLLRNCRSLSELYIHHNDVNIDAMKTLSDSLYYCNNLQVLDAGVIFDCTADSETVCQFTSCLCSIFVYNLELRNFNIEANFIGTDGVIALIDGLKHCSKLQVLSIGSNEIMNEGAVALAGALKHWRDLRILRVGTQCKYYSDRPKHVKNKTGVIGCASDYIGMHGFTSLADNLKYCTNLEELDVSGNNIDSDSISVLLRGLQANSEQFGIYKGLNDIFRFKRIY